MTRKEVKEKRNYDKVVVVDVDVKVDSPGGRYRERERPKTIVEGRRARKSGSPLLPKDDSDQRPTETWGTDKRIETVW